METYFREAQDIKKHETGISSSSDSPGIGLISIDFLGTVKAT